MSEKRSEKLKAIEDARAIIEASIADHERAIARIRVDRNRTLPVAQLPHSFLLSLFHSLSKHTSVDTRPYRWLRITHVCHDWREIALADTELWSNIKLVKRVECLKEIFLRSKDSPLCITTPSLIWDTDVLEVVMGDIRRIQTLSLFVKAGLNMPDVGPSTTAPELRKLVLNSDSHHPPTPLVFSDVHMPKLAHLELGCFRIRWDSPIFKNSLTHFTWSGGSHSESHLSHMLAAFTEMPLLQFLSLTRVLPPVAPVGSEPSHLPLQTVTLSCLRSLQLTDSGTMCTQFLRHIDYPSTTTLAVTITYGTGTALDVSALCDVISTRITDGRPHAMEPVPCIRSIIVKCSSDHSGILAWTKPFDVTEIVDMAEKQIYPHLFLRISVHGLPFHQRISILDILQHLPIYNVQALHLQDATEVLGRWSDIAKCMPKVKQFAVGSNHDVETGIARQLTALAVKPTARRPNPRKTMLFRGLKTLMLIDVMFREDPEDMDDNFVLQGYRKMFASRLSAGHMIEELIFHDVINIGERDVQKMKKFVGKVTWDPEEVIWESKSEDYASESCPYSDFYYSSEDSEYHRYYGF